MTPEQIGTHHQERLAVVYIRQSTVHQVQHHLESLRRQRHLVQRAQDLGWPPEQVVQLDDDLGQSAGGRTARAGFEKLVADVALGKVGLVLALEASRLSRNNRDWYHLLERRSV